MNEKNFLQNHNAAKNESQSNPEYLELISDSKAAINDLLKAALNQNTNLIKNIDEDFEDSLSTIILDAALTGKREYEKLTHEEFDLPSVLRAQVENVSKLIKTIDTSKLEPNQLIAIINTEIKAWKRIFSYYCAITTNIDRVFSESQDLQTDCPVSGLIEMTYDDIVEQTNSSNHKKNSDRPENAQAITNDKQTYGEKTYSYDNILNKITLYNRTIKNLKYNRKEISLDIKKPTQDENKVKSGKDWIYLLSNDINKYENRVKILTECLLIRNAVNEKLENAISGNCDQDIEEALESQYHNIKYSINDLHEFITKNQINQAHNHQHSIKWDIIRESLKIVTRPYYSNQDKNEILNSLNQVKTRTVMLSKILKILPNETIANFDLRNMPAIIKLEDVSGAELAKKPELVEGLYALVESEFPGQSAKNLLENINNNPSITFTISMIDNQVICFFGREKKSESIYYIDWFIANSDLDTKGLGEATLRLAFDEQHEKEATHYAVAKPHVKSYELVIEKFGFVGSDGATLDGEHHHHYARIRRFPTDENFASKNISIEKHEAFLETIKQACHHQNLDFSEINIGNQEKETKHKSRSTDFKFESLPQMRACKVQFPKKINHHTDILPNTEEGWFYDELNEQAAQGYVLTRYIRSTDNENPMTFYAVFEKDQADQGLKNDLQKVIYQDIKKAISYK